MNVGARYDEPAVGRWITADNYCGNLYQILSLNRYLYCEDDPVNGVDPSGNVTAAVGATVFIPGVGQVVAVGIAAVGLTVTVVYTAHEVEDWLQRQREEHEKEKATWHYGTQRPTWMPPEVRPPGEEPPKEFWRKIGMVSAQAT